MVTVAQHAEEFARSDPKGIPAANVITRTCVRITTDSKCVYLATVRTPENPVRRGFDVVVIVDGQPTQRFGVRNDDEAFRLRSRFLKVTVCVAPRVSPVSLGRILSELDTEYRSLPQ
jgi:hypothetical protein